MDIQKIIQTAKTLKAFIGESVLDEDELQSDKRKRRRVGIFSLILTIALVSDLPGYLVSSVKTIVMAPPPKEESEAIETDGRWVEFLERRITVNLDKINELNELLKKARNDLKMSEADNVKLKERIEELIVELKMLKQLSTERRGGRLYDRLQQSQDR